VRRRHTLLVDRRTPYRGDAALCNTYRTLLIASRDELKKRATESSGGTTLLCERTNRRRSAAHQALERGGGGGCDWVFADYGWRR